MKISDFKKELKKLGVPYSTVEDACDENLKKLISESPDFQYVIFSFCVWDESIQGHGYWSGVYRGIKTAPILIPKDQWSINYPRTKNWKVGCQQLDKKSRKLLFKVLADDLGYDVED